MFLEPDRALKIKRAVRLPFLDYSTLEKRNQACEEELAINRRHASKLYRRVVPITRGAHGPEIGGDGPVLEWAVEMARFDEEQDLRSPGEAPARITPELAEAVADVVRESHERAERSDGSSWLASIAADHRSQHAEVSRASVSWRAMRSSSSMTRTIDGWPRFARCSSSERRKGLCAAATAMRISATSS